MPRIFISYRRDDSRDQTERIHDRLVQTFGKDNVFLDVDGSIASGSDYAIVLRDAVRQCDVLLVIIGPDWLNIREKDDPSLRRLDNPDDFVRIEVESGLGNHDTLIIPVLVKDASPPSDDELPESLVGLAGKQVAVIRRNPDFHKDVKGLIDLIKSHYPNRRGLYAGIVSAIIFLIVASAVILIANGGLNARVVPSDTPEPATVAALRVTQLAGETLTAIAPTLTHTPDWTQTIDAMTISIQTQAAETIIAAYTDTPTLTFTPSNIPQPTEDLNATATRDALTQIAFQQATEARKILVEENITNTRVAVMMQETLNAQASANVPTDTPAPTLTPSPLPTTTPTRTSSPTITLMPTSSPTPKPSETATIDLTGTASAFGTATQYAASAATQAFVAARATVNAQGTATQVMQSTLDAQPVTPIVTGSIESSPEATAQISSIESCTVQTDQVNSVTIRVGPGINRGAIAFLPPNQSFKVLGQATASDGSIWWKLDKSEVIPTRASSEAWVAQSDVIAEGICDQISAVGVPTLVSGQTISTTDAVYQTYEHGFMIWRKDTDAIYIFGVQLVIYVQSSYQGLPPNTTSNAPKGFIAPVRGFGLVWWNNENIRNSMGWATSIEQSYTMTIVRSSDGMPVSFTLPDGRIVHIKDAGAWSFSR